MTALRLCALLAAGMGASAWSATPEPAAPAASLPLAASAPASSASPPPGPTGDWRFEVTLDGKPIGEHRFTVTGQGNERQVHSVASFDVKFFGLTAYSYRHEARERWRDGCLISLDAHTDDDRKPSDVKARKATTAPGAALQVSGPGGEQSLPGCVMTFAYWNPAMRKQAQLLNPQTGRYERVEISTGEAATVNVRGKQAEAIPVHVAGPKEPLDLWYSPQGDWLALDSKVGQRSLSYRLK